MANEGRYDFAARRRGVRRGREKGCWIYIPKVELEKAERLTDAPPYYRVWATDPGSVMVRLYEDE
jgi:hypothetical protein